MCLKEKKNYFEIFIIEPIVHKTLGNPVNCWGEKKTDQMAKKYLVT